MGRASKPPVQFIRTTRLLKVFILLDKSTLMCAFQMYPCLSSCPILSLEEPPDLPKAQEVKEKCQVSEKPSGPYSTSMASICSDWQVLVPHPLLNTTSGIPAWGHLPMPGRHLHLPPLLKPWLPLHPIYKCSSEGPLFLPLPCTVQKLGLCCL